jgi:hypothetical protein
MLQCAVVIQMIVVSVPIVILLVVLLVRTLQYVECLLAFVLVVQIVIVVFVVVASVKVIISVRMVRVKLYATQMEIVVHTLVPLINAKVINGVTILIVLRELVVEVFVPELATVKA